MKKTNYYSNATLIKKDGKGLSIDGMFKEHVDLDQNELEVTFLFQDDSYNLKELKSLAQGGSIVPQYEMSIDGVRFDVFAMGAKNDTEKEITCFIVKKGV